MLFLVGLQPPKHRFNSYKCILRGRKNNSVVSDSQKNFFDFNIVDNKQNILKNVVYQALTRIHLFSKCRHLIVYLLDIFATPQTLKHVKV